jgi:hypothetical protein
MTEVHFYKPEAPESIWIDRGPNGGWMFRTEKLHDSVRQYVPADTIEAQAAEIAEYRRQHCSAVEIARPLLDALETQATSIKRLREALRGMVEYSRFNERWQDDHPEYVAAARAALGETE